MDEFLSHQQRRELSAADVSSSKVFVTAHTRVFFYKIRNVIINVKTLENSTN